MNAIHLRFTRSFYVRQGITGAIALFPTHVILLVLKQLGTLAWLAPPVIMGPWLPVVLREMRLAARKMDDKGVTRGDGRRFLWNDFVKLQEVHRILQTGQQGVLNHVDLHFAGGRVRILLMVLENGLEAVQFARRKAPALAGAAGSTPAAWS